MVLISAFLANLLCAYSPQLCYPTFEPPTVGDTGSISFRSSADESFPRQEWPIVKTEDGEVKGYTMKTIGGREIHAFDGIPFAEPPIGDLRFRSPVKKRSYNGTLLTQGGRRQDCIQIDLAKFYAISGVEDCLYINVYTPDVPRGRNASNDFPVFIWFYGGAYFFGSKDQYGPAYLLEKDVILVTVNYRLGVFGFLSTGDAASPGNWGLKDQAMAMQWVHDNIKYFGGDESKVTLIGQSAGAASVHLHMLSKKTRGLFHYGISQSASAFCPWAINKDQSRTGRRIARLVNCPSHNSTLLVSCLRTVPALTLMSAQPKLYEWMGFPAVSFTPTIEPEGPDAFITESPEALYAKGDVAKVPWITGLVPDEGNIYNILMMINPIAYFSFNRDFDKLAPMTMNYRGIGIDEKNTTKRIRKQYFGDRDVSYKTLREHSNMYGDRYLLQGIYRGMQEHSKIAPTFGYYFNYYGKFSILQRTGMTREEAGVSHFDDVIYLFNSSQFHPSIDFGTSEYYISEFLVDLWSNFASLGEPVHTNEVGDEVSFWPSINPEEAQNGTMKILEITQNPKMITFPKNYLKRIQFWDTLNIPVQ